MESAVAAIRAGVDKVSSWMGEFPTR